MPAPQPERTLGVPSIRYVSKGTEASCSFPDEPAVDLTLALPTSSRTVYVPCCLFIITVVVIFMFYTCAAWC